MRRWTEPTQIPRRLAALSAVIVSSRETLGSNAAIRRDGQPAEEIRRVREENFHVYTVCKDWR